MTACDLISQLIPERLARGVARNQHPKRDRGQRAVGEHRNPLLARDPLLDRRKRLLVEPVGQRRVERLVGIGGHHLPQPFDLVGHFGAGRRQRRPERFRPADDPGVARLFADMERHHGLVVGEQHPRLVEPQGRRFRQRHIAWKFALQRVRADLPFRLDLRDPLPELVFIARVAQAGRLGGFGRQRPVEPQGFAGEVLIPAHELGEPARSRRIALRQLLHRLGRRRR